MYSIVGFCSDNSGAGSHSLAIESTPKRKKSKD